MPEYIDREAVYKMACRGCTRHGDEFGSCYHEELCEELQSEFASAPIADVEPVRHGRWEVLEHYIDGGTAQRCALCKKRMFFHRTTPKKYCPNCGAKMDGEVAK